MTIDSLRAGYPMSTFDSAAYSGLSAFFDTGGDSRQHTRNETQQLPRPISTSEDIVLEDGELVVRQNHGGR